jgi:2-polyprenyl-6-methoxyphenol hydroxylase-like FAD-dependent oxidoreductase
LKEPEMPSSVVVLGAGPAGAATGLFLARRGHEVTILDSNPLPPPLTEHWERRYAFHTRQGHIFLALGTRVLDEEAPDLAGNLLAAGAHRVTLQHDSRYWNLLARRRLFDAVLLELLSKESGVRLLTQSTATGLITRQSRTATTLDVFGIRTPDGDITGDLVIDAGGWRSPVPGWLAAKHVKLKVFDDPTCFFYLTQHFRLRRGATFPSVRVPIIVALDFATVLAFPEDNDNFQLSVQLDLADPTKRALRNPAIFERFLAAVPAVVPWLESGEPVSDPEPTASVGNCRKQNFDGSPQVTGLLMVGDAAVHTNPSAARGVALALAHARSLANLLDSSTNGYYDPVKLIDNWEQCTAKLFDPWLKSQIRIDRERRLQIRSVIEGRPWKRTNDFSTRLINGLAALGDCPTAGAAGERLFNLLSTPEEIYGDREIMRRVFRETRRAPLKSGPIGPSRQEYESLIRRS